MAMAVAKNSSMIVPCMVNSWLYCSLLMNCRPGRASSARMASASRPANRKNANDVTMYIRPMVLWSVVVRILTIMLPRGAGSRSGGVVPPREVGSDTSVMKTRSLSHAAARGTPQARPSHPSWHARGTRAR